MLYEVAIIVGRYNKEKVVDAENPFTANTIPPFLWLTLDKYSSTIIRQMARIARLKSKGALRVTGFHDSVLELVVGSRTTETFLEGDFDSVCFFADCRSHLVRLNIAMESWQALKVGCYMY